MKTEPRPLRGPVPVLAVVESLLLLLLLRLAAGTRRPSKIEESRRRRRAVHEIGIRPDIRGSRRAIAEVPAYTAHMSTTCLGLASRATCTGEHATGVECLGQIRIQGDQLVVSTLGGFEAENSTFLSVIGRGLWWLWSLRDVGTSGLPLRMSLWSSFRGPHMGKQLTDSLHFRSTCQRWCPRDMLSTWHKWSRQERTCRHNRAT